MRLNLLFHMLWMQPPEEAVVIVGVAVEAFEVVEVEVATAETVEAELQQIKTNHPLGLPLVMRTCRPQSRLFVSTIIPTAGLLFIVLIH